jgi:hypothetical protein
MRFVEQWKLYERANDQFMFFRHRVIGERHWPVVMVEAEFP